MAHPETGPAKQLLSVDQLPAANKQLLLIKHQPRQFAIGRCCLVCGLVRTETPKPSASIVAVASTSIYTCFAIARSMQRCHPLCTAEVKPVHSTATSRTRHVNAMPHTSACMHLRGKATGPHAHLKST